MHRSWEYAMDNSYEEGFALGVQETNAKVILRMYENGYAVEEIAFLLDWSIAEIMSYTASIYALQ